MSASGATECCLPTQVRNRDHESLAGHRHALRLPPAQAAEARRRARANAAKKGRPPQARTLIFAEWVLIWTTLPPEIVSTATIMALYRVRWPIERVFKRLKSILNMDHLRARKDSPLAEVYLHGKLLYAWIVEKRLCRRCGHDWHRLDQPRRATPGEFGPCYNGS
ncbi:MAG: transposase [Candidatus Competibacteraceae bacterium]|nr:transposase [Candidatus Competibacteraceae bacterium]MBK8752915.1 transposase [Candidatus Competibacteraceae bacterium]